MSQTMRLAAVDIGTVTARMLVADVSATGITEVERRTDIVHLGQGLAASGRLSADAIERLRAVVSGYSTAIADHGVAATTAVATSASRDASNGDEMLAALASVGVEPRIIDGETEARLSFFGAAYSVTGDGLLVVDVGGGSTELIFGSSELDDGGRVCDIEAMRSIDVGSRRITEMFLASDPPTSRELDEARGYVTSQVRPFFETLRSKPRTMVSLAGAATTFSAIELELASYDSERVHLSCLTGPRLTDIIDTLSGLPLARRREVVGLHPERASVIVGGGIVIETVLALAGLDSTLVSEHDILYGILLDTYRDLRHGAETGRGEHDA
ncbi:MAG: Ppx/GppA family phosphatase [Coriobacteriia bacterium]|nr:Ppx/GppA family phosphatase [Coriobacteriia bacterium]